MGASKELLNVRGPYYDVTDIAVICYHPVGVGNSWAPAYFLAVAIVCSRRPTLAGLQCDVTIAAVVVCC